MKILSLFDGISCGYIACQRAGIKIDKYWASEIDDYAVGVSRYNFPDIEHIGDVHNVRDYKWLTPDLLTGGSPCQGFSYAGKGLDFDDKRSALFFEYHRLLIQLKPKYFLYENVPMKEKSRDIITTLLGVEPIEINSALVSAQNRRRLYWTNISVTQPVDKNVKLNSVINGIYKLIGGRLVNRRINEKGNRDDYNKNIPPKPCTETRADDKMNCITTVSKDTVLVHPNFTGRIPEEKSMYRHLKSVEYERLQTLPDGYTKYGFFKHDNIRELSKSKRHKLIGNGWTVDVIAHILKGINNEE